MYKDKIIVLGDGFLGQTFKRRGYTVLGRNEFEWNGQLKSDHMELIYNDSYDAIINTIGVSDTRYCENPLNWTRINSINGMLPGYLSSQCHIAGKRFVHISTGCLYDTRDVPQAEDAFKSAHCNYVVSKWIGEMGCSDADLVIRPRLIFDSRPPNKGKRNNLLCKIREFSDFVGEYNTVTSNDTIVEAIQALLDGDAAGVFNVGQTGHYTIADMARHLGLTVENELTQEDLHITQGLYLVNNLMDLSKIQKYYQPRDTLEELTKCWELLNENK